MPIGNIGKRNLTGEKPADHRDRLLIVHFPNGMTDTIRRNEIIQRRMPPLPLFDEPVNGGNTLISQKDIPRLRPDRLHMVDPVILFLRPRELMLADDPLL